jgi:hypothetical protein
MTFRVNTRGSRQMPRVVRAALLRNMELTPHTYGRGAALAYVSVTVYKLATNRFE